MQILKPRSNLIKIKMTSLKNIKYLNICKIVWLLTLVKL